MKITLGKTLVFLIFTAILSTVCMGAFASEITPYPINTPWETKLVFKNTDLLNGTYSTSSWNSKWISTFCDVVLTTGGSAHARDGYTDPETEQYVYDNPTGTEGDYYLFISQKKDSATRPVIIYFNTDPSKANQSHANGGAIYSNAIFDFDVRVQSGNWSGEFNTANGNATTFIVYGWDIDNNKRVTVARMSIDSDDTTSESWYPTYYDTAKAGYVGMSAIKDTVNWYKLRICVDAKNQKITYYCLDNEGRVVSQSAEQDFPTYCDYVMTSVNLAAGCYRNISIDNVRVVKETYLVDEPIVTENENDITATVKVGHNVYAVGSENPVVATSPTVVLAAYDAKNRLLGFKSATVEFSDKLLSGVSDAVKKEKFSAAPEYKDIELKLDKPKTGYNFKLYVWNSLLDATPYVMDIK